jgi:hypothetical protein
MPPPKEEPEEIEEDEEFDDEEEMEEGMDMAEMFSNLLATEDGETMAEIAKRQADAAEKIALNIEMQNKVLVKILTVLTKLVPTPVAQATDSA